MARYQGKLVRWVPSILRWRKAGISWRGVGRLLHGLGVESKHKWRRDHEAAAYVLAMQAYRAVKNVDAPKSPYQLQRQASLVGKVLELKRRLQLQPDNPWLSEADIDRILNRVSE